MEGTSVWKTNCVSSESTKFGSPLRRQGEWLLATWQSLLSKTWDLHHALVLKEVTVRATWAWPTLSSSCRPPLRLGGRGAGKSPLSRIQVKPRPVVNANGRKTNELGR